MKSKFAIFNLIATAAVLFSVVFQSVHSVEHIVEELQAPKCHHEKTDSKHELSHQHHKDDNCFVCHFNFSGFIGTEITRIRIETPEIHQEYSYIRSREITSYFVGSLFAHRGPPVEC
ncbi:hypothetical protein [Flavobacterium selenitireducens]|uniref:hypothetical protein n=1 Tax=Flavobacterium selenitireducens TaxID=2722704 RepID=UPI00168A7181|nr:hypothetical protein [Flavobacterium selenitireducens]MBD3582239.1 hypothetical protein [Flavobacterium selenitireducens]